MTAATATNSFLQRLIGAVSLDAAIYEEVEADRGATGQALLVVVLSSVSAGIGARGLGGTSIVNILFITVVALMGWAAWALVTLQVGGRLLPEAQTRVDVGELLRTTGFAAAPGILRLFGVLPGVTIPVFALCAVWMLAAMVVAVRQALDYTSTGRAILVCLIGWTLAIALVLGVGLLFGPTAS
jgi:Yip1 domain